MLGVPGLLSDPVKCVLQVSVGIVVIDKVVVVVAAVVVVVCSLLGGSL